MLRILICLLFSLSAQIANGNTIQSNSTLQQEATYRKLDRNIECPLDYWMVSSAAPFFDYWRSFGITANHLTLMGGIVQLLACLLLLKRHTLLAGVFWIFGYYFDGIDGSYARYHHLCSAHGDLFDHLKDWICFACLMVSLYFRYALYFFDYLFVAFFMGMLALFLGAQEQYVLLFKPHTPPSTMLSFLTRFIGYFHLETNASLSWLRWFGPANSSVAIAIYIALLPWTRKERSREAVKKS